jgi:hypothetical protein
MLLVWPQPMQRKFQKLPIAQNDLRLYMQQVTDEMQADYERIRGRSREDAGTAGDNSEEDWKKLLSGWLPPIFPIVTKGRIMNTKGECSDQVDLLVLSPWYPTKLLGKKEYLEGGVLAAFECRLTLRSGDVKEVFTHAKQITEMSQQWRAGSPYRDINRRIVFGLLAQSHDWNAPASTPLENVRLSILEAEQIADMPNQMADFVTIANLGTWASAKMLLPPSILNRPGIVEANLARYGSFDYSGGVVEAGYVEYSDETQHVPEDQGSVTPIGALIVGLLEKLAWDEPSLRTLAEYFILSNVTGSGRGILRSWSMGDCLDPNTMARVFQGNVSPAIDQRWNEWGISL